MRELVVCRRRECLWAKEILIGFKQTPTKVIFLGLYIPYIDRKFFFFFFLEIINLQDPIEEIIEEKVGGSPKFKKSRGDLNNAALRKSCEFQAFFNKQNKATEKKNSSDDKKNSLNGAPIIEKDTSLKKNLFSGKFKVPGKINLDHIYN